MNNAIVVLTEHSGWASNGVQLHLEPALANLTNITNVVIKDIDTLQSQLQQSGNHHIIEACIKYKPVTDIKATATVALNDQINTGKTQVDRTFKTSLDGTYSDKESVAALETLLDQCNAVEPGTEETCYNNVSVGADTAGNDAITHAFQRLAAFSEFSEVLVQFTSYSLNVTISDAHNRQIQELEKIKTCISQQTVL